MKKITQSQTKLTKSSYESLQQELKDLQENQLPEVIERIAKAREQGDLSENSEYKDAKDQQELLQVRIDEIAAILSQAEIVKEASGGNKIGIGSVVTLVDEEKKQTIYTIVSEFDNAAATSNTISAVSPIGSVLLHKEVGDKACAQTPVGEKCFKIKAIK